MFVNQGFVLNRLRHQNSQPSKDPKTLLLNDETSFLSSLSAFLANESVQGAFGGASAMFAGIGFINKMQEEKRNRQWQKKVTEYFRELNARFDQVMKVLERLELKMAEEFKLFVQNFLLSALEKYKINYNGFYDAGRIKVILRDEHMLRDFLLRTSNVRAYGSSGFAHVAVAMYAIHELLHFEKKLDYPTTIEEKRAIFQDFYDYFNKCEVEFQHKYNAINDKINGLAILEGEQELRQTEFRGVSSNIQLHGILNTNGNKNDGFTIRYRELVQTKVPGGWLPDDREENYYESNTPHPKLYMLRSVYNNIFLCNDYLQKKDYAKQALDAASKAKNTAKKFRDNPDINPPKEPESEFKPIAQPTVASSG